MNSNSGYNRLFDPMAETGQPLDFAQHGLGQRTVGNPFSEKAKMSVRNLNVYYDDKQAIHDVSLDINRNEVLAKFSHQLFNSSRRYWVESRTGLIH